MEHRSFHLTPDVAQLPALRHEVAVFLHAHGWAEDETADVLLVVSELATNALVHAQTSAVVRIVLDGDVVLEVADQDPMHLPLIRQAGDAPGGMGLRVVEHVARSWVVTRSEGRKVVRAVLERPKTTKRPI
jgi:anti-sigma regulatory factor (Ser/Thr protein kinase)